MADSVDAFEIIDIECSNDGGLRNGAELTEFKFRLFVLPKLATSNPDEVTDLTLSLSLLLCEDKTDIVEKPVPLLLKISDSSFMSCKSTTTTCSLYLSEGHKNIGSGWARLNLVKLLSGMSFRLIMESLLRNLGSVAMTCSV